MKTGFSSCRRLRSIAAGCGWLLPLAFAVSAAAAATPLEKTFRGEGGAYATVRFEPGAARPGETVEAVVSAGAGAGVEATLPPAEAFADRFDGFETLGSYADPDGTLHFSLAPVPGAEKRRLRPFPVETADSSTVPPTRSWFAAGPVAVPEAPPAAAPGEVSAKLRPARILPSPRRFLLWAAAAAGALVLAALAALLARRLGRAAAVRRLTPKSRALHELGVLLGRDLPSKGRFKDYYAELALVVRRYVERRHGIRAPRQTTEEFLASAAGRPEFPAETVGRLRDFLESADLVKFAGVAASRESAQSAAAVARTYLEAEPD